MAGEASSSVNESGKSVPLPDAVDYPTVTGDETQQEKANKYSGEEVNNEIATESLTTQHEYLSGIKLIGVASALFTGSFLSILEISIVSTALINITDDLKSFDESSWIITAYLLTYTGFLIIWAKFSDTLGRRACLGAALIIFVISSGACGAAQTIDQLIVFRAFQGIGASGIVALTFVIIAELVPVEKYAMYSGITAIVYGIAYLMGPLIGGAICENTTWRWIFLINLPIGIVPLVLLYAFMPSKFPDSSSSKTKTPTFQELTIIDYMGAISLFGFCVFLVAAFQEANTRYRWNSAVVIILFVFSGLFFFTFLGWQKYLSTITTSVKAMFPWKLMKHRLFMCTILLTILSGAPFTVAVIQIPQRYQAVGVNSPIRAGVNLLPFTLLLSVGSIFASISTSRSRIPPIFVFLAGAILQTIGCALMSTLGVHVGSKAYGYEVILATGLGLNLGMGIILTPQLIRGLEQSTAMGAVIQARPLGGAIGLAVTTSALNSYVKTQLAAILNSTELSSLLQSVQVIEALPAELQASTRVVLSDAYDLQMQIMIGFSAAQVLVAVAMWEKKLTRVA